MIQERPFNMTPIIPICSCKEPEKDCEACNGSWEKMFLIRIETIASAAREREQMKKAKISEEFICELFALTWRTMNIVEETSKN